MIDMSPPYQRGGGIWNNSDQAFLIDSIINGFDIPKIYVADFTYGDSPLNILKTQYAMVDGKQRFEAIFGFFLGNVLLAKDFVYDADPSKFLGGLSYRDLKINHPSVAEEFENYNLNVMSIITQDVSRVADVFVRLNRNRALTGAELRNAMRGPVPDYIRQIADHRFFLSCIRFSISRGQHRNTAAKLLLIEFRDELVDVKKTNLDRFVREAERSDSPVWDFEQVTVRVKAMLDVLADIFIIKDPLLRSEGPVVMYYWFVRTLPQSERVGIREFFVFFESIREQNRKGKPIRLSSDEDSDRLELHRFDALNRSTNDSGSLVSRFAIMQRWLRRWKSDQP